MTWYFWLWLVSDTVGLFWLGYKIRKLERQNELYSRIIGSILTG